ncbi:MAG: hypothetical protein FWF96_06775, partial [Kiritimatiellaeota bacterium]|nr:hypothetical protein [Kiritimatiellota bacterium]
MNTNENLEHPGLAALLQALPAPARLDAGRVADITARVAADGDVRPPAPIIEPKTSALEGARPRAPYAWHSHAPARWVAAAVVLVIAGLLIIATVVQFGSTMRMSSRVAKNKGRGVWTAIDTLESRDAENTVYFSHYVDDYKAEYAQYPSDDAQYELNGSSVTLSELKKKKENESLGRYTSKNSHKQDMPECEIDIDLPAPVNSPVLMDRIIEMPAAFD